jgi:hypothetical protein
MNSDSLHQIASVHHFLRNITWDTWKDSIDRILESDLVQSEEGIRQIASGLLAAVNARPLNIAALAQFATSFCESLSHQNLQTSLFKMMTRCFAYSKPVPTEAGTFAFLFQGFKTGLFSWDSILRLARFTTSQSCLSRTTCWLLSYFASEFEATDPDLTYEMIRILHRNSSNQLFPQFFRAFSENLARLSVNNWDYLKRRRDFFTDSNSLRSHL